MRKHFIGQDGGVVRDEDLLDGKGRDFGDEDAADGICEGGINADDGKGCIVGQILVEFDLKVLAPKHLVRQSEQSCHMGAYLFVF